MTLLYADASALARAYFIDEPDHAELGGLLFGPGSQVATSELARVELAAAIRRAERAGRLQPSHKLYERLDKDCSSGGSVALARFDPQPLLTTARQFVIAYAVRTLDALHLATASLLALMTGDEITFVTRDRDQALAAEALGFNVQ